MNTPLLEHLHGLCGHMAWADAVWYDTWAKAGLQEDPGLLQRAQHTADVQGAFLAVLTGGEVAFPTERPAPEYGALRTLTQARHGAFATLFQGLDADGLSRTVLIPWFPGPPCHVTVTEALTQVTMHTQHHRGQLMSSLKALGGKPQNVDFLIWAWKQRPEGRW